MRVCKYLDVDIEHQLVFNNVLYYINNQYFECTSNRVFAFGVTYLLHIQKTEKWISTSFFFVVNETKV